jgi:hypothetical protein
MVGVVPPLEVLGTEKFTVAPAITELALAAIVILGVTRGVIFIVTVPELTGLTVTQLALDVILT